MANSKWLIIAVFFLQIIIFAPTFLSHQLDNSVTDEGLSLSIPYGISKAAGTALHINLAILMLPACQSLLWLSRNTIGRFVRLEDGSTTHNLVACSVLVLSLVHAVCQWVIFAQLAVRYGFEIKGFVLVSFVTGIGWSGHAMLLLLVLNLIYKILQSKMSMFTSGLCSMLSCKYSFVAFFALWAGHGAFCIPDWSLHSFAKGSDVFWKFWIGGATIYLMERLLLGLRLKQKAQILKVIQHPNDVIEVQFEKMLLRPTAGQNVFLSCPAISLIEKRQFALTSAPEEDYLSVHLQCSDDYLRAFAASLGCAISRKISSAVVSVEEKAHFPSVDPSIRKVLPQVYVDGPFGNTSGDVFNSEVAILVGAGAGVFPFASVLKCIWYRMNRPRQTSILQKVYFFWICHDFESFEWFRSLLMAIEFQDMDSHIEVYPYLTAPFDEADATKHMINSTVNGADLRTGLRAPTRHGHPHWDEIFSDIAHIHAPNEAGVFVSGPTSLCADLEHKCEMASKGSNLSLVFKGSNF